MQFPLYGHMAVQLVPEIKGLACVEHAIQFYTYYCIEGKDDRGDGL